MGKIIREVDRGTRVVADVEFGITELIWDDGARSFDVYRVDTEELLTETESFDAEPTDEQIRALLEQSRIEP